MIHELIEKEEIGEIKVDEAMERLGEVFSQTVVTYYGVLLLIASYVLEELRKKNLVANLSSVF